MYTYVQFHADEQTDADISKEFHSFAPSYAIVFSVLLAEEVVSFDVGSRLAFFTEDSS